MSDDELEKDNLHEEKQELYRQLESLKSQPSQWQEVGKELDCWAEQAKDRWYHGTKNTLHDSHDIANGIDKALLAFNKLNTEGKG